MLKNDILSEMRNFIMISNFLKMPHTFAMTAARNGEINLASFCSSGVRCSAPGCDDLVHLHALTACFREVRGFYCD